MITAYIQGMAIGAQNAFVLSQGIRRQHHWLVAAICCSCDRRRDDVAVAARLLPISG